MQRKPDLVQLCCETHSLWSADFAFFLIHTYELFDTIYSDTIDNDHFNFQSVHTLKVAAN